MHFKMVLGLALAGLLAVACDQGDKAGKDGSAKKDDGTAKAPDSKSSATAVKDGDKPGADANAAVTGQPEPTGNKPADTPVTSPEQQSYSMEGVKKIADNCAKAYVIMSTAPDRVGEDYAWTWARQALLANQQFKVVDGEPQAPGQVSFELHKASDRFQNAWVLVAKCKDGGTCNYLAAMHKAIVKGSSSTPVCGPLPMDLSPTTFKKPTLRAAGFSTNTLPEATDGTGLCARLHACTIAMDTSKATNIGFDCQKAPSKFKTACARNYPCQAVMDCLAE
jgi:hypothetical protein